MSASSFPDFVSSQVSSLLASGVVSEASEIFRAYSPLLLNPLGVVFRPSDRARARIRLRAELASQEDLDAINTAFAALGDKQLKARLIMGNSMSKLNDHSLTPPFQYSSVDDLAALITPGCWIATCDVEAFYHRFSIALLWRFLFGFVWGHLLYYFCVVVFGFGPAPYYASGWSAEFYRWILHKQIPATVFMDDWATVGAPRTVQECLVHQSRRT